MKIYKRIVFDADFNVIEEDSYEYEGEVALCAGGSGGGIGGDPDVGQNLGPMGTTGVPNSYGGWDFGGPTAGNTGLAGLGEGYAGISQADLAGLGYGYGDPADLGGGGTTGVGSGVSGSTSAIDASLRGFFGPIDAATKTSQVDSAYSAYMKAGWGYAKNVLGSILGFLGVVAAPEVGAKVTFAGIAYSNYINLDKSKATLDQSKAAYDAAKAALDAAFPGQTVSLNANTGQVSVDGKDLGVQSSGNSPEAVNAAFAKYDKIVAQASGGSNMTASQLYLQQNPDVAAAGMDAWAHYQRYGQNEGRAWPSDSGSSSSSNLSLEDQLKQEQLNILRKQSSESDALSKLIYQAAGIVKDTASGEWRKATEDEKLSFMSPAEQQEYAIYKQTLDRQQKALAGELPISPALEKEITDWNAQNEEALTRQLGTGFMTSTPGIQSQENQNIRTGLLTEEARRGQITSGQSQITAWQNSQANAQANQYNALIGIPGRTSSLLTGYSNALVPYTQANLQNQQIGYYANRNAQILADTQAQRKQATKDANTSSMWSAVGQLGGYLFS